MIHNIASFFSEEISMPLFDGGPGISYKLEHLAKEHQINAEDAHDAIADCNLMISLCEIIKDRLPDVFQSFINTSTKQGIKELLYSDSFLALGEIHRRHVFQYPVVFCGSDPSRPNEIVLFDLSYDPEDILDLDYSEINKLIQAKGRDGPLKKYKINKTIPVCSSHLVKNKEIFDISFQELQDRADRITNDKDFQSKISQAMEDRMMSFPEPEFIEASIYSGGFPSQRDKDLMQEFHLTENKDLLIKISRNFEDDRFKIFAERIICTQFAPDVPDDINARYNELLEERTTTDGKWGSITKSIKEIDEMLEKDLSNEDSKILKATRGKLSSMVFGD
jgi:exodeoxyribonuclease-1